MEALLEINWIYMLMAAFAGGAFGAAIGALPAFCFTGIMVVVGEGSALAGGAGAITGDVAFGPVFGPHISFAGGAAAAAYAAKKGYMDTGNGYHEAKNIAYAFGTKVDVLIVGGLFGILGLVIQQGSIVTGVPWDHIAFTVVVSAILHRVFLGYSVIGTVRGGGIFDMTPFERDEKKPDGAGAITDHVKEITDRPATEPWLPHQYKWGAVAFLGLFVGILGAFIAIQTESAFLAFGISAASLFFLNLGVEKIPVTHHITLPASTAALAVMATGDGGALIAGVGESAALVVGALFGCICALFGEAFQRVFYAHGDTHVDPPAAAITFGILLVGLFYLAGIFGDASWVIGG